MRLASFVIIFVNIGVPYGHTVPFKYRCEDAADDLECKRRGNEGLCGATHVDFTCGCLFHDKPAQVISRWDTTKQFRNFSQTCETVKLAFHEDTCKMYLGNPNGKDDWKMSCPNDGFIQTWGGFIPEEGSFHSRLWYRCCNVKCPNWTCMWSPFTKCNHDFEVPLKDAYVRGVRNSYFHDKRDSSWSLEICQCTPIPKDEL